MHKLDGKTCPLLGEKCLLAGCALFSERLDGCEISIMNYNLYQLKEHIKAQLEASGGADEEVPKNESGPKGKTRFPRPVR
ncbi:MAG: hypothetical protein ABIL58_15210 [Pseudomonadota bacterium]